MTKFADLAGFYNRHQSERAWIFGKGPGLDCFPQDAAGCLKICINESLSRVEAPRFFFAHDEVPIQRVAGNWPTGCNAILEQDRAELAFECGVPQDCIFIYEKCQVDPNRPVWRADEIGESNRLLGLSGTVHSAIHFCCLIGVEQITMVGFDGQGGYAESLDLEMPMGGGQHGRIKNDSIRLLGNLGIAAEFFLPDEPAGHQDAAFDYCRLYDRLREHGYHSRDDQTSHLGQYVDWITSNLKPQTALDVGCSTGESLEILGRAGIVATGVEVSSVATTKARGLGRNVVRGTAIDLPFETGSFDLVCSADVFEHLTPSDGRRACEEACRVARKFVFLKIAEKQDVTRKWKDIAGHPLHLTTEPIDWWKKWLAPFGNVLRCEPEVICLALSKVQTHSSCHTNSS